MRPLDGIKVVELASYVFVPAAGATLADWGAEVIKIEHPLRPDPQRVFEVGGLSDPGEPLVTLMHHSNRGKRGLALDVGTPEGYSIFEMLIRQADVFLTNLLPGSCERLKVDPAAVRAINPRAVYARGSGYGPLGPDRDEPGFDGTAYWARGGIADSLTPTDAQWPSPSVSAMGDLPGGTALAGAIAAGLVQRERTGIPPVVDVSLLGVAVWGAAPMIMAAAHRGGELPKPRREENPNPLSVTYRTRDHRFFKLSMLQSDKFFEPLCRALSVPELAGDPRFATAALRSENSVACVEALDRAIEVLTADDFAQRLSTLDGAWALAQSPLEVARDPQVLANGYLVEVDDGTQKFPVAAAPGQFDQEHPPLSAAPEHGESTEEILLSLGIDWDEIAKYKDAGVIG